jgi:excinuclease ABC subunit A
MRDFISVRGAREHNLKNIDVDIPRDQLVVFTGVSGSGKSSLAFDTIYNEGQRRYVESLSTYARQFLGQMEKPDVDLIEGLSPSISIDQKTTSNNPRSTVGTVTEIYDYLRLLFARVGKPHCPHCGIPIERQSVDQIVDAVLKMPEGTKIKVLAPVVKEEKGEHKSTLERLLKEGFIRLLVDGYEYRSDETITLAKNKKHSISVVVDRLVIKPDVHSRLAESLELAFELSSGLVVIQKVEETGAAPARKKTAKQASAIPENSIPFSQDFSCPQCGFSLPELTPRMFSFNNPYGACPECDGLGEKRIIDPDLVFNYSRSVDEGPILPWNGYMMINPYYKRLLLTLCEKYHIPTDVPLKDLPPEQLDLIQFGNHGETMRVDYVNAYGEANTYRTSFEGVLNNLERRYRETQSQASREDLEKYMTALPCTSCAGKRLRPEVLAVLLEGRSIAEVSALSIAEAREFFAGLNLSERDALVGRQVIKEIRERLNFMINVGLDYLSLDRQAGTLSGGEAQRIRLATQVGASLMGVLYVLDEPSIGLHPRDNERLILTLKRLRDLGNTVIVVEHDEETMQAADYIIDIGPGAGVHGGEVVGRGSLEDLRRAPRSITGQYLAGERSIPLPETRRPGNGKYLTIKQAAEHNLQNIDVSIPLGTLTVVTGVSGSGKSTLIEDILYPALMKAFHGGRHKAGSHATIEGISALEQVINIDQSAIGRTPRSNPATYTGVFDAIRKLYTETEESRVRGYKAGRFSFNVRGGRCEACSGDGIIKIEMHFLPDVYIPCEVCKGKRYNRETLEVKYKGKNISDVLDMTVDEAVDFFAPIERIHRKIKVLQDVGLGYITLGQPAPSLSGGEAQRVKLATELSKQSQGKNLYILDEPTTGLHMEDVRHLLGVLNRLVDAGNSVVVIEHNLDVMKAADYIIDLGPEGGDKGGRLIATGTPEAVAKAPGSYTGEYLARVLPKNKK